MAVRGAESKQKITDAILSMFAGAFVYNKELRIPCHENGERIEIKVALTAAKENIKSDYTQFEQDNNEDSPVAAVDDTPTPTDVEKEIVRRLMDIVAGQ